MSEAPRGIDFENHQPGDPFTVTTYSSEFEDTLRPYREWAEDFATTQQLEQRIKDHRAVIGFLANRMGMVELADAATGMIPMVGDLISPAAAVTMARMSKTRPGAQAEMIFNSAIDYGLGMLSALDGPLVIADIASFFADYSFKAIRKNTDILIFAYRCLLDELIERYNRQVQNGDNVTELHKTIISFERSYRSFNSGLAKASQTDARVINTLRRNVVADRIRRLFPGSESDQDNNQ